MAYHRSLEVVLEDDRCVGWFPYSLESVDVLDILIRKLTSVEKTARDIQAMRCAWVVPVKFKLGSGETLEDA